MIALFTDYGLHGPYLGQVQAVLHRLLPGEKIINLLADAPRNNPRASAYLLAAFSRACAAQPGTIFFAVVDPGVGSFQDCASGNQGRRTMVRGAGQRPVRHRLPAQFRGAMPAHRLVARNVVSQLSRPGFIRAGCGQDQKERNPRRGNTLGRPARLAGRI